MKICKNKNKHLFKNFKICIKQVRILTKRVNVFCFQFYEIEFSKKSYGFIY